MAAATRAHTRRDFLARAAVGAGMLALGDAFAARAAAGTVPSWPHSLEGLDQNGIGSTSGAVHMHWDLPHDDQRLDFCYAPVQLTKSGTIGWLVFREQDAKRFYQLEFRTGGGPALVKRSTVNGVVGVFQDMAVAKRPIDVAHPAMFRLELVGSTFTVRELAEDGTVGPVFLQASDSLYPTGVNFSYYTSPGQWARWNFVKGMPL